MKKYFVYSPEYDDSIGGVVALHNLCNLINSVGSKCYMVIFHINKPDIESEHPYIESGILGSLNRILLKLGFNQIFHKKYKTNPFFKTPVWKKETFPKNSVIIYPEVVSGNPLQATNVVRWFLHKPGFHTGEINFGEGELYFFYKERFNDFKYNKDLTNSLEILTVLRDIYNNDNNDNRCGDCFILRKGNNREKLHNLDNAIIIDGKSHKEISDIFKSSKRCISYDLDTMYTTYAVISGCEVIVVPDKDTPIEKWRTKENRRYGIAYGDSPDQLKWAKDTKDLALNEIIRKEDESKTSVINFIRKVESFFN